MNAWRISILGRSAPVTYSGGIIRAIRAARSGPEVAADRQDDISRLLLGFDVPGRRDHLLQGVGPIDDRAVLPRVDELLEQEDVFLRVPDYPEVHLLVSDPPRRQGQDGNVPEEPHVRIDIDPARLQ